jgi:hypothetical protein
MKQKLLTQEILKSLRPYGSQDGNGDAAIVYAKFFTPFSNWTWLVLEEDLENGCLYGLVKGHEVEYGSFSLEELESLKGPGGCQGVERDTSFRPMTLGEAKKKYL